MSKSSSSLPFSTEVVRSFRPSKSFYYHKSHTEITSLDFDDTGLFSITSGEDESIQLYDCKTGKHSKTIFSKKYGVHLARFTHNSMNCVYASTKEDDTIRYLSLHDNHYIRYFRGHKDRVCSLEVSPLDDLFLSAAMDHSVRLWDLRSSSCQGLLNIPAPALVAFDSTATVFAVASPQLQSVSLYSIKSYETRPFLTFQVEDSRQLTWCKLEFSNNGKYILLVLSTDYFIFDAYNGTKLATLRGGTLLSTRKHPSHSPACFSVDGRFVFGTSNDKICIWDTNTFSTMGASGILNPTHILENPEEPAAFVAFSPKTMLLATANTGLTLWLPERSDEDKEK